MTQASTVISNWREFDERRLEVEREWQPGNEVPRRTIKKKRSRSRTVKESK